MLEWQIYWSLEPPLADRLEVAIGILASLLANINRDPKKKLEPFEAKDFMIQWDRREEPDEEAEPKDWGAAAARAFDVMIRRQEIEAKLQGKIMHRPNE